MQSFSSTPNIYKTPVKVKVKVKQTKVGDGEDGGGKGRSMKRGREEVGGDRAGRGKETAGVTCPQSVPARHHHCL